MRRYILALRGPSAVRLSANSDVRIQVLGPDGTNWVTIRTIYRDWGSGSVPMAIWLEVAGPGRSLEQARSSHQTVAESVANVLSLTMNAAIEPLTPTVVFDISPRRRRHEYSQLAYQIEQGYPCPARLLDIRAAEALFTAIERTGDRDQIDRALACYREAMRHIVPGQWVLAVAYTWMGMEALKTVALSQELARLGISQAQLASSWGVTTRVLSNEARKRLVCKGNLGLHDRLRATSNDLEHALTDIGSLHGRAERDARSGVSQLRRAMLRCLFTSTPRPLARRALIKPFPCAPLQEFVHATLRGDAQALTESELEYPHFDVNVEPLRVQESTNSTYSFTSNTTITPRLGSGVAAMHLRHEIIRPPGTEI